MIPSPNHISLTAGYDEPPTRPSPLPPKLASASGSEMADPPPRPDAGTTDNPMLVLVSGILLLGGIAVFIGWGLTHAYPGA